MRRVVTGGGGLVVVGELVTGVFCGNVGRVSEWGVKPWVAANLVVRRRG